MTRKQRRSRRLLLEQLEDRLSPAANLLVTTTIAVTEQVLREFTPGGDLVRTALLPAGQRRPRAWPRPRLRPERQGPRLYAGLSTRPSNSYTLDGGGWTHRTHSGWSTVNNVSYGGIGVLGDYVYVTDMTTFSEPADEAKGVVRFNLADGTSARFLETEAPQDLTIGKDGRLYLLERQHRQVLRPDHVRPAEHRYAAGGGLPRHRRQRRGRDLCRQLRASRSIASARAAPCSGSVTLTGVSDPMDIDVSGDGRVAIGTVSGHVVQMSENLTGITTFAAGSSGSSSPLVRRKASRRPGRRRRRRPSRATSSRRKETAARPMPSSR